MTRTVKSPADRAADRLDREQRAVDRAKAAVERAAEARDLALVGVERKRRIAEKRQLDLDAAQEALAAAEARRDYALGDPDLVADETVSHAQAGIIPARDQ